MSYPVPPQPAPPPSPPAGPSTAHPVAQPLDYAWLTRPGRRWWRILLSLLLFAAIFVGWTIALTVVFVIIGVVAGWGPTWFAGNTVNLADLEMTPAFLLYNNLLLAGLIPATIVSTWVTQRLRPGFTHSVAGRFRWGLFGQLTLVLLPVWLVYIAINAVLSGSLFEAMEPDPQLVGFLVVIWLTTPLQCAGEEYAFRGWLLQNVGGLIPLRALAWAIPAVLSAVLFSIAHTSFDPWVLLELGIFATAVVIIIWRTGGIEGAIALHMLNNMIIMHYTLVKGGFDDAFITPESSGQIWDVLASLIGHGIAVAVVLWWA
ncbi:MAG: type II CAAX endopeptidase family protein, partial [Propionibacteriaceae bacterium]|nr:type II CAAX endopeptidase family protein [Propionibacteriaceae bacterium]